MIAEGANPRRQNKQMKTVWNIIWRVLLAVVLLLYVAVALVNYSVVQSYLGTLAGHHFSKQWGGEVRIGSIEVTPWDHLSAHNILLVTPTGDTIFDAETLKLRFRHFPFRKGNIDEGGLNVGTLDLHRLYLANAYYHFESIYDSVADRHYTNLQFIIDSYASDEPKTPHTGQTFTVNVRTVVLNHVHYRMDLPDNRKTVYPYGVQIPHMEFYDIRARIKDVHVVNDDVTARLITLSTEERSGFKVDKISAAVHVSPQEIRVNDLLVETPKSHIALSTLISYDGWGEMDDYTNTVQHRALIQPGTTVAMSDVAYWAPVLWGINAQLNPCGSAHGTINDLHTDGLTLTFGRASRLDVEGNVRMVEHIDSMSVDLRRLDLRFEQSDLTSLRTMLPQYITPEIERRLDELGYLDLSATADGGLHRRSTANVQLVCALGNLQADATAWPTNAGYTVNLDAGSHGLGLTSFGSNWLSHTGFELSAQGELSDKTMQPTKGEVELQLVNSVLCGTNIQPATVKARLDGDLLHLEANCDDSLLAFNLQGDADLQNHQYNADLSLANLNTTILPLKQSSNAGRADGIPQAIKQSSNQATPHLTLSTHVNAELQGATLDSVSGNLRATGTHLALGTGTIDLREVDLNVRSRGTHKRIRLESDPLSLSGYGRFLYADLPLMVRHFASQILPADLALVTPPDSMSTAAIADNTLSFTGTWNDDGSLLAAAGSTLAISRGTRLSASYNHRELLKLALRSDSVSIGTIKLDNLGLSSRNAGANYIVDLDAEQLLAGSTEILQGLNATLSSNPQHTNIELLWGSQGAPTRGDLMLRMADGSIAVERPDFYIGDTRWTLDIDSLLVSKHPRSSALTLRGKRISLASGQQSIVAALSLLQRDDDHLALDFNNFNLGGLCKVLLQDTPLDVDGRIGGHFEMHGLQQTPYFNAALVVDSCIVNRQPLGTVDVKSTWNAELNTLNLQLASQQLAATGWIELGTTQTAKQSNNQTMSAEPTAHHKQSNNQAISFHVQFDDFQLALAAPFLSSFSSRFEGLLHGNFDISGTLGNPVILGEAMVEGGALKVDPTGVTYYFDDELKFNNNTITLDNFLLRDPRNNLATINGQIRHNSLQNIMLDLTVATDNLLLLDQRRGDDFYGTLLASANASVTGSTNNIDIMVNASTKPGCSLTVPLSNLKHVKSQNYITFVSDQPHSNTATRTASNADNRTSGSSVTISVDLAITPDLQLNLPMDFSEIRAAVRANGSGDLHILLDRQMEPFVTGNYEIIQGDLNLNLLSLVEKKFTIENGSNLSFNGSLPNARFDLRALYSQRANLSSLTGALSSIDNTQKYIQVDDIISIAGTLQEPTVSFDLRLPNADQSVQDEVFSYIDRNSERDMINQTVSLLLLGQFYNVSGVDQGGANAASGSIGTIASAVGSIMADMVQIVDINVDYKAATDLTNQQLDLNISKDWGRWYLESTLGYGGESRQLETNANNAVLDALIGYRISPLVHLFAYNRTNTNDYTRTDLPYKQGVGLKLTKDFDSWHDLFGHKNKKKKK